MFTTKSPLLQQLSAKGLEFDQLLRSALSLTASRPDISPEDIGFPDSYLTLALYRLNSSLARIVDLDETRYNLFHDYKLAPKCLPEQVVPGTKLCSVLKRAVGLAEPSKVIGAGHFLRAVVQLSLDDEPWDLGDVGFPGQVVHNTFSIETLLWGMGHTAWTPLPKAPEVRRILESLHRKDPVEDIPYLLTIERGRLVVRPASVLGGYRLGVSDTEARDHLVILPHLRENYACIAADEILELEDLINNPLVREDEIQRFFEYHPHFLRQWDYREIHPHLCLTREEDGPLVPDFLLIDPNLRKTMLLELKLPKSKLVRRRKNRFCLSQAVEEARAQLLLYREWFEDRHNRAKLKGALGMDVYRPRMGVIIGRRQEFRDELELQRFRDRASDLEVVTYDDILEQASRRLALIGRS